MQGSLAPSAGDDSHLSHDYGGDDDPLVGGTVPAMSPAVLWLRTRAELFGYAALFVLLLTFAGIWLKFEGWVGLAVGGGPFLVSVLVALLLLAMFQHVQNVTTTKEWSDRPVWGMPIAFAGGILAKLVVVFLNIIYYILLAVVGFDMDDPKWNPTLIAFVAAFVFIALPEETTKYLFLHSFDNVQADRFGRRLNLYHPMGIVLLGVALSLGGTGFSLVSATYEPDHGLPWYYIYSVAVMEPMLNAATGAMVGAIFAAAVFEGRRPSHISALLPAMLFRGIFFVLAMLPFREEAYKDEAPLCHFMRRVARMFSDHDASRRAQVVGHRVALIYACIFLVTLLAGWFARARVRRLLEVYGSATQQTIGRRVNQADDL